MTKLGTKARPIIVRVGTEERGQYIAQECAARGWQYIIGFEPDKPEDISDFEKAENPPSPIHSDKVKSLDWKARRAKKKTEVFAEVTLHVRAKLKAVLQIN